MRIYANMRKVEKEYHTAEVEIELVDGQWLTADGQVMPADAVNSVVTEGVESATLKFECEISVYRTDSRPEVKYTVTGVSVTFQEGTAQRSRWVGKEAGNELEAALENQIELQVMERGT